MVDWIDDAEMLQQANKESAEAWGWSPKWLGLDGDPHGDDLAAAIRSVQGMWDLPVTGYADDATARRMLLEEALSRPPAQDHAGTSTGELALGDDRVVVDWPHVVSLDAPGNMALERVYRRGGHVKHRFGRRRALGSIDQVIVHWDVTPSAATTRRVLSNKGISTHMVIDHDGTVYQLVDLRCAAWHAGVRAVNRRSIGIDLNTEVGGGHKTEAIQRRLAAAGRPRPVVRGASINGWKPGPFLGVYPRQVEALVAVLAALARYLPIPLVSPAHTGKPLTLRFDKRAAKVRPPGVYHHAEVRRGKWDTAGVDLADVCQQAASR